MSSNAYEMAIEIAARTAGLTKGTTDAKNKIRSFADSAKKDMESLKRTFTGVGGKLAALGVGIGTYKILKDSAALDKSMTNIRLTAQATMKDQVALRKTLFEASKETGKSVEDLKSGFDSLIQSGLNWKESTATIKDINIAMAVTGSEAQTLASGLTVAKAAFDFDLTKPGMALNLLDKMTVAGRLGNAELEDLSAVFGRIGVNAASAGMSFDKTLAFVETLSMIERSPERLATLADSTLRLFTNARYMQTAQKKTGVKFFDADGSRRDAMAVLVDIKKKYDTLSTDVQRSGFIQKAFGKADLDTIKGMRTLLGGDMLAMAAEFERRIKGAGGTLKSDQPAASNNAKDQANRLQATFKLASDAIAKPVNTAVTKSIKMLIDKDKGNMSGGELTALGIGGTVAAWAGSVLLKGAAKSVLSRFTGTAAGIAEGKAIEAATGIQSVFIVNWPTSLGAAGTKNKTGVGVAGGAAAAGGGAKTAVAAAGGLALPVAAGLMVAGGVYGAYKINQRHIRDYGGTTDENDVADIRNAIDHYQQRTRDNFVDPKTGKVYRPRYSREGDRDLEDTLTRANRYNSMTDRERFEFNEKSGVNVTVNIDKENQVTTKADNLKVNTKVKINSSELVVYQGDK